MKIGEKMHDVMIELKQEEGFKGMPYKDTRGKLTIGYGTKLPITEQEATILLGHRLEESRKEVINCIENIHLLPNLIIEVLVEMNYQLGTSKFLEFKRMLKAVDEHNWKDMIKEMKDSKWYGQTKNRVDFLIKKVKVVINEGL